MSKTIEIPDIVQWEETDSELAKYTIGKLEEEIKELQERIDKAIEYLEYQLTQLDFYEDTKARVLCSMLIVILKGCNE